MPPLAKARSVAPEAWVQRAGQGQLCHFFSVSLSGGRTGDKSVCPVSGLSFFGIGVHGRRDGKEMQSSLDCSWLQPPSCCLLMCFLADLEWSSLPLECQKSKCWLWVCFSEFFGRLWGVFLLLSSLTKETRCGQTSQTPQLLTPPYYKMDRVEADKYPAVLWGEEGNFAALKHAPIRASLALSASSMLHYTVWDEGVKVPQWRLGFS